MKLLSSFLIFSAVIFLSACGTKVYVVYPDLETAPVANRGDAADDPAIYIHPSDRSKDAIIGTDKQKGLVVYNTEGAILHEYAFGRINNVDIRQNVTWMGNRITIVGGSNRSDNSIVFYRLNEMTLELYPLNNKPILSKVDEVYGFCLYQGKDLFAFVVGKDGVVEQWKLLPTNKGNLSATLELSFDVGSQCEGMVADDELGYLYVGEEEIGIWKYNIANWNEKKIKVALIAENNKLKADIEGLTMYYGKNEEGYLIASSQGNHTYAIYERQGDNKYIGSFRIDNSKDIDGTFDTDGIDVTAKAFGEQFPSGIFIAQDGKNGKEAQNFKVVDWSKIEKMITTLPK